jgi:phosphoglycerate dehydrogenase-like enzyme
MAKILVISRHAQHYGDLLDAEGIEVACFTDVESARNSAADAEILFGAPDLLAPLLPHCPAVRWVQSSWAGIAPLVDCPRRDYLLTGVKDIFGAAMTEFVLGWLLAIERRIPERFRAGRWDDQPDGSVQGKRVGIMGTGSIGCAVARGCRALGLTVHGLNSNGRAASGFDNCWPLSQRLAFAGGLDYLVTLLPDTPETDQLVNQELLDALNPGAVFINAGRGNVVAMEALLAALEQGQLRHAVLDVLPEEPLPDDDPLWRREGLSITSHTAAPTSPSAIVAVFRDNYRRYLAGESLRYPIDLSRGY